MKKRSAKEAFDEIKKEKEKASSLDDFVSSEDEDEEDDIEGIVDIDDSSEEFDLDGAEEEIKKKSEEGKDNGVIARAVENISLAFLPQFTAGAFAAKHGFGLDLYGKLFAGREWLTDQRFTWNNPKFSENLIAQASPYVAYAFTRSFFPDNRYLNLSTSALSAIIPIINNLTDGRKILDYGYGKENDFVSLLTSLLPLGIEAARKYFPKMEKTESITKTLDIADTIVNGKRRTMTGGNQARNII